MLEIYTVCYSKYSQTGIAMEIPCFLYIFISLISLIIDNNGKKDAKSRCLRLRKAFEDPLMPIHLSFFSSALNVFTTYDKFFTEILSSIILSLLCYRRFGSKISNVYFNTTSYQK